MTVFSSPVVRVEVNGARGASFADIARRNGNFGVLPSDTDEEVNLKLATALIEDNPGFKGDKGDPGENAGAGFFDDGAWAASPGLIIDDGVWG
jgi:hypothetical protein